MNTTITIPVIINDEYLVFTAKIIHDNYYNPLTTIVYKNTIGDIAIEVNDMGEYRAVSNGLFPPNKTWLAKPAVSGTKNIHVHANDQNGNYVEFNLDNNEDLNGYMDVEIRIYP